MKNGTLIQIIGQDFSNRVFEQLDKEEFEDIFYVDNILSDFLPVLQPNEELVELSYQNGGGDFIEQQIETNSQVDFQQLFRTLFRSHQEHKRLYEEGNQPHSTVMICCSMTIMNEMIERIYN